jgi:hypothetical protein
MQVHYDDDPPYYTIQAADGSERQTLRKRLRAAPAAPAKSTQPPATPATSSRPREAAEVIVVECDDLPNIKIRDSGRFDEPERARDARPHSAGAEPAPDRVDVSDEEACSDAISDEGDDAEARLLAAVRHVLGESTALNTIGAAVLTELGVTQEQACTDADLNRTVRERLICAIAAHAADEAGLGGADELSDAMRASVRSIIVRELGAGDEEAQDAREDATDEDAPEEPQRENPEDASDPCSDDDGPGPLQAPIRVARPPEFFRCVLLTRVDSLYAEPMCPV